MTHDQERERFEKWCREETTFIVNRLSDGSYSSLHTEQAWIIWQAAKREPLGGWQDISTAPKDGSEILLAVNDFVGAGFYHDGSECYGHRGGAGWFEECDRGELLTAHNVYATHWQPLPAPPKQGESNE